MLRWLPRRYTVGLRHRLEGKGRPVADHSAVTVEGRPHRARRQVLRPAAGGLEGTKVGSLIKMRQRVGFRTDAASKRPLRGLSKLADGCDRGSFHPSVGRRSRWTTVTQSLPDGVFPQPVKRLQHGRWLRHRLPCHWLKAQLVRAAVHVDANVRTVQHFAVKYLDGERILHHALQSPLQGASSVCRIVAGG